MISSTQQLAILGFAAVFFLLQLRLPLALPDHQSSSSRAVADHLNRETDHFIVETTIVVPKKLEVPVSHHETKGLVRLAGGGGGHAVSGGAHGNGGYVAGDNGAGGGTSKSPDGQGAGVIPVYAAGSNSINNRNHHNHGTSSGTITRIGSSCLALILLTSFIFVYPIYVSIGNI